MDGLAVNIYNSPAHAGLYEIGHYTDISKPVGEIAVFELCCTSTENVKDLSELYFRFDYVHKTEILETAFAIGFSLLFVAVVVFFVIILCQRRKNAK